MAREFIDVHIGESGRDAGKVFRVTEMTAEDAEWWALRAMSVIVEADTDGSLEKLMVMMVGETEKLSALGVMQVLKLLSKADPYKVRPLWDEMKGCWQLVPEKGITAPLVENSIEEVSTLLTLRMKTLELHFDFFMLSIQTSTD